MKNILTRIIKLYRDTLEYEKILSNVDKKIEMYNVGMRHGIENCLIEFINDSLDEESTNELLKIIRNGGVKST